jgi:uncharacterized membrane protein YeaQ/YmgE (transglycosylase-associated protein family)
MLPWIVIAGIGVALAAAAYFFSPGRIRGGLLLTLLVGAVAAVALTWLGRQVGMAMPGQTFGFFIAVIGTALVLAVWRTAMGRA